MFMKNFTEYVAGFYVCQDSVLLVQKQRGPEVLHGCWNAIGGAIEDGELSEDAMAREFKEETGCTLDIDWLYQGTLTGDGFEVDFYLAKGPSFRVPTRNDVGEPLAWWSTYSPPDPLVPGIEWQLPLCLNEQSPYFNIYQTSD